MPDSIPNTLYATPGMTIVALTYSALSGLAMLLASAELNDPTVMKAARDSFEQGILWPGASPLLIVIGAAICGSIISGAIELLLSKKSIPLWRLYLKMGMQPIIAISLTTPIIKITGCAFTETTLMSFSFTISACSFAIIAKAIPYFEDIVIPKVLKNIGNRIDDSTR